MEILRIGDPSFWITRDEKSNAALWHAWTVRFAFHGTGQLNLVVVQDAIEEWQKLQSRIDPSYVPEQQDDKLKNDRSIIDPIDFAASVA